MFTPASIVLVFAALLLGASASAQQTDVPAEAPAPRIAVGADAVSDAALTERLRGIVAALPEFGAVEVGISSGVVTLTGSVAEAAEAARLEELAERVEGVVAVRNELEATRDVGRRLLPAVSRVQDRLRQAAAAVPLLLLGLTVFAIIAGLGLLLTLRRPIYDRIAPNPFVAQIYRQAVRMIFLFVALAVTLDLLGATALLGTILGAAGILGLAIGFGVRDTIENYVASVMLSLRQPFAPNDLVEIEGELGRVVRLTSRATVLLSLDGNHVRLPNAVVFKSKIVNYTREPERRFVFDLGIDPDTDLAEARATGLAAVKGLAFVLDEPPAQAWIEDVGDSNVILRFAGWIDQNRSDFALARGEAIRMTKAALESRGFALPEPIYRLRFDRRPETQPAPASPPGTVAPKDETIERKVEADRRTAPRADLLRPEAASE